MFINKSETGDKKYFNFMQSLSCFPTESKRVSHGNVFRKRIQIPLHKVVIIYLYLIKRTKNSYFVGEQNETHYFPGIHDYDSMFC